jgi:hypothetical protein
VASLMATESKYLLEMSRQRAECWWDYEFVKIASFGRYAET